MRVRTMPRGRRRLFIVVGTLVLVAVIAVGGAVLSRPSTDRPATAQPMVVDHVYDGDTVWLRATSPGPEVEVTTKVKVRLIGVDTPELVPEQCFARQATDAVSALLPPGSTVYVTTDRDRFDRYQRRLLYIWTADGTFLNDQIVAQGWGRVLTLRPDVAYATRFEQSESAARRSGKGLWGAC